jgi:hypothetical protein
MGRVSIEKRVECCCPQELWGTRNGKMLADGEAGNEITDG